VLDEALTHPVTNRRVRERAVAGGNLVLILPDMTRAGSARNQS